MLVPVVLYTLSTAVSVSTPTGVVGDEAVSQGGPLVVWVVVAVLAWRYETDRLASNPLSDDGRNFVTLASSGRGTLV